MAEPDWLAEALARGIREVVEARILVTFSVEYLISLDMHVIDEFARLGVVDLADVLLGDHGPPLLVGEFVRLGAPANFERFFGVQKLVSWFCSLVVPILDVDLGEHAGFHGGREVHGSQTWPVVVGVRWLLKIEGNLAVDGSDVVMEGHGDLGVRLDLCH